MPKKIKVRLYIESQIVLNRAIPLSKDHLHYCFKVMRIKVGDNIFIFNKEYGEWECQLCQNFVLPEKLLRKYINKKSSCTLLCSKIPNQLLKQVIRQATELNVDAILLIETDFCNQKLNINYERLKKIAIEASEQCERMDVPIINDLLHDIEYLLNNFPENTDLIFCDENLSRKKIVKNAKLSRNTMILIGPEGGFSDHEREMLHNFPQTVAIKLSDNILQVDTAIVTAINYINFNLN